MENQLQFDSHAQSIAERKIKAALDAREKQFAYVLAGLHSQAVKNGAVGGSGHRQVVRNACETELRERLKEAWEILRSVAIHLNLPRSIALGSALKSLIRHLLVDFTADLEAPFAVTTGSTTYG